MILSALNAPSSMRTEIRSRIQSGRAFCRKHRTPVPGHDLAPEENRAFHCADLGARDCVLYCKSVSDQVKITIKDRLFWPGIKRFSQPGDARCTPAGNRPGGPAVEPEYLPKKNEVAGIALSSHQKERRRFPERKGLAERRDRTYCNSIIAFLGDMRKERIGCLRG